MPFLPVITPELIAASKMPEEGWSLFELEKVEGMQSKNGKSINYFFRFNGVSGPGNTEENANRAYTLMIAMGAIAAGMVDQTALYISLICGLANMTQEDLTGKQVDPEVLVGKKVWLNLQKAIGNDGKEVRNCLAVTPDGVIPF